MLSRSPPAVLPLISGFPPFAAIPTQHLSEHAAHPQTAPPAMLMDTAWSQQPSLHQETACSKQGWEHAWQTWECLTLCFKAGQCLAASQRPLQLWKAITETTGDSYQLCKELEGLKARDSLSWPQAENILRVPVPHLHHQALFHHPPLSPKGACWEECTWLNYNSSSLLAKKSRVCCCF